MSCIIEVLFPKKKPMTQLTDIARQMVAPGKGILAADESPASAGKRLAAVGMDNTPENRRAYRDLFLGTDGIGQYLSGVILHDETLRQDALDGTPFLTLLADNGILPGIKVDEGLTPFPGFDGEELTRGLDTLPERCADYAAMGARFTKWRDVIHIGADLPTPELMHTNAITLARYARIVQDAGMVPMLEPEVLLTGNHSMARAEEVTRDVLSTVFYQCRRYRVDLSAVILKTSMVVPGDASGEPMNHDAVAEATLRVLRDAVPAEVPGIVFLSGGQSAEDACRNLAAINRTAQAEGGAPWPLTFSFARALQGPALHIWRGEDAKVAEARKTFLTTLRRNTAALEGADCA